MARFKLVEKPLRKPPHHCLVTRRSDVPIVDFGVDYSGEAFPHVYISAGQVERAAKECLEMVSRRDLEEAEAAGVALGARVQELEAQLKVKSLTEDGLAEAALLELAFVAAGAATAPLLQDNPDYVFPAERVKENVNRVVRDFLNPVGEAPDPKEED